MTNKLPVVGKRYKSKEYDGIFVVSRIANSYTYIKQIKEVEYASHSPSEFLNYYEEILENGTQSHSETKTRICPVCKIDYSGLDPSHYCSPDCQVDAERLAEAMKSDEVKEAMEFLRLETNLFEKVEEILDERLTNTLKVHYKHLASATKNLLNALDKQFANNDYPST